MAEIQKLKDIKSKYSLLKLSEADTRFKIIDEILVDILKWPKETITTEKYVEGNRADYVLNDMNQSPILVVESKKNGIYFTLPKNLNSEKKFEKIQIDKLLTDDEIKSAIYQVREYAEDLLCNYACICNGQTWIFFRINSKVKPWKKLFAYVIKDIDYFIQNYTEAVNIFGYSNIIFDDSLNSNIGVAKKMYKEVFYPKIKISAFDTPVNNNKFAGSLRTLSNKFLGPIPELDIDFMENCYVSGKGQYDNLQKNVQGFLYDSLTPYFKNLGFREFSDDKNAGAFGLKIADIVKKEKLNNVLILFGGRGAGKSTFLKRFLYQKLPLDIQRKSEVALVGLLHSAQNRENLTNEIWESILVEIDKENFRNSDRERILELFSTEFDIYERQILVGLEKTSEKYQELVREFLTEKINDTKLFCEKLSLFYKSKNKALVIFIDNIDQLPSELQDTSFLTASEISDKLKCLVIVSMREERYFEASSRGVLDAYQSPGYHLASPVIPLVIQKRLEYIIDKLKYTEDLDREYGISSDDELVIILNFLNICKNQLKIPKSPLSFFLRYATHGDVRQALEFFKGFLTSGYTNITEMAPHSSWHFQVHQVIKPMMIPERFFYDERFSKIPNLYQLRNDNESSHFTGLRILQILHNKLGDKASNSFVDVKYLISIFEQKYDSKRDCIKNLELFLEKGIIEANNRLETFSQEVNQIKLSSLGNYLYEYLAFNFAYLDLICLDAGNFDEALSIEFVKSANLELEHYYKHDFMSRIELRINRVQDFLKYLKKIEDQEIIDLNLGEDELRFCEKIEQGIFEQIEKIRKSAQKKQTDDYGY